MSEHPFPFNPARLDESALVEGTYTCRGCGAEGVAFTVTDSISTRFDEVTGRKYGTSRHWCPRCWKEPRIIEHEIPVEVPKVKGRRANAPAPDVGQAVLF